MSEHSPIQGATTSIVRDFDLDPEKAGLSTTNPEDLHERILYVLTHQISYLIEQDMDRLKWILYRIDVPEHKLLSTLQEHPTADAPGVIAQMILDRQIEKAKTRARFSTGGEPEWKDC